MVIFTVPIVRNISIILLCHIVSRAKDVKYVKCAILQLLGDGAMLKYNTWQDLHPQIDHSENNDTIFNAGAIPTVDDIYEVISPMTQATVWQSYYS